MPGDQLAKKQYSCSVDLPVLTLLAGKSSTVVGLVPLLKTRKGDAMTRFLRLNVFWGESSKRSVSASVSFASEASASPRRVEPSSSLPTRSPISLRLLDRSSPSAVDPLLYWLPLTSSAEGLGNNVDLASVGGRSGLEVIVVCMV